eukprot:gb/GECG01016163.1/.p1 GENE.gb/GECG01016163.1/~~gb/GECG01016163.1/.p1  ORF type:complete len:102 (+),score=9.52 gb/GECG01016163.1/:1-306(+)
MNEVLPRQPLLLFTLSKETVAVDIGGTTNGTGSPEVLGSIRSKLGLVDCNLGNPNDEQIHLEHEQVSRLLDVWLDLLKNDPTGASSPTVSTDKTKKVPSDS